MNTNNSKEKELGQMRFVTDQKSLNEYKRFLETHERCNFQQSPEWAKVKSNWKNF